MKTIPTKADFEHIIEGNLKKAKTKLKKDGADAVLATFYLLFMKRFAEETDKLLYIDNTTALKERHVKAAAKKSIDNYSYALLVRKKLRKENSGEMSAMNSIQLDKEEEVEEEEEEDEDEDEDVDEDLDV